MPEYIFDQWSGDPHAPDGTICVVKATSAINATVMMGGLEVRRISPNVPVVPLLCLQHGTICFGGDLTYQLRTDSINRPNPRPSH